LILLGDCLERLKELEGDSVDSVVTDPPYGWRFMGKAWDGADIEKRRDQEFNRPPRKDGKSRGHGDPSMCAGLYDQSIKGNEAFCAWTELYARELLRVLKPGGHALIFCGPRTYHAMAFGVERAGFEIRDQLQWLFGSGFPKSHNGAHGGTSLKPANEPIVLARKPLSEKTVKANFEKWGVGGLNIDESRIGTEIRTNPGMSSLGVMHDDDWKPQAVSSIVQGRWPANLILDETAAEMLDEQSGTLKNGGQNYTTKGTSMFGTEKELAITKFAGDSGGASRFFYCAKASKAERSNGLDGFDCANLSACQNDESTELVLSTLKVISALIPNSSIVSSGENITAIFPKECLSITRITIQQITELKTWNSLMLSHTSDSMRDAVLKAMDGISHVNSAANSRELMTAIGILAEKAGSVMDDAKHVTLETLSKLSEQSAWKNYNSNHPTVKPLKLMEYLIKLITPPGGVVLDPFMGSGSTGVAAKRLGFSFIGIEMNEEYCEIAKKRIEHVSGE